MPNWFINEATVRLLPGVASQLYDRAVTSGGDLFINQENQTYWSNVVDLIKADPNWQKAVKRVKDRVCNDILAKGVNKSGKITWQEIRDRNISAATALLSSNAGLLLGLKNVYTPYKWEPIPNKENWYKVTVYVYDRYNFEVAHVYREMQDEGSLWPYDIVIETGETFEICCPPDGK